MSPKGGDFFMHNYTPTPLMLPTSHYDRRRADFAVNFISMLKHTTANGTVSRFS